MPQALGARSLTHWATKEVLDYFLNGKKKITVKCILITKWFPNMVPECNIVNNSMSLLNIVFAIRPVRLQGTDQKVEVFHRWTGKDRLI